MVSPGSVLTSVRNKRPFLDHLIRAFGRYQADAGDRQAAAVTFFGFLSFFPLIALATSLLSYVLGDEAIGTVVREVDSYASGLAGQLKLQEILTNNSKAGATGLIGLAGLLYAGLGWVDALREAIRTVWHHNVKEGNLVVKKVKDVVVLAGLGVAVVLSVGISAATGAFTGFALDVVGLERTFFATAVAKVVGVTLGLATSTGLFLYLFWRLPKVRSPLRRVVKGALLAGLLFEVLKRVGAVYIERTTENPVYGAFAVIVGLLVWINIVSRMLLVCAAWTVTAPYDSDIEPSGTASVEAARQADIPTEFADTDPDDPPAIQQDGAPSPLAAAVQGVAPQQDDPSDAPARAGAFAGTTSSYASLSPAPVGLSSPAAPSADRTQVVVRSAAQFTAGALGMVVMAVVIHVLRTLRGLVRR
jgi:membrane protein